MSAKITKNELFAELDRLRGTSRASVYTPEIDEIILRARNHKLPVSYSLLQKFIESKFKVKIGKTCIRERYKKLQVKMK